MNNGEYSFILFGDLHWDRAYLHPGRSIGDAALEPWSPSGASLSAFRKFTAELQVDSADWDTPRFAMQLGDMINGTTGDEERQCEMLRGAWADFRPCFNIPFIPVIGNHEFHSYDGKDGYAMRAWNRVMAPHACEECGCSDMRNGNCTFTIGPDLFVCINTNEVFGYGLAHTQELVNWLGDVFDAHPGARYTFLCGHHNFVPSTDWGLHYQRPFIPDEFFKVRHLISKRGCIALTADLHQLVCTDYTTNVGSFTELVAFSIPPATEAMDTYREAATSPEHFPVHRIHGAECDPISLEWVRDHYASGVTRFWYASIGSGAYVVHVKKDGVEADLHVYGDNPREVRRHFVLRSREVNVPSLHFDPATLKYDGMSSIRLSGGGDGVVCRYQDKALALCNTRDSGSDGSRCVPLRANARTLRPEWTLPPEIVAEADGTLRRIAPTTVRRVATFALRLRDAETGAFVGASTCDFLMEPEVRANSVPYRADDHELAFTYDEKCLHVSLHMNAPSFKPNADDTTLDSRWWEGDVFELFFDWGARHRECVDEGAHQFVLVPLENGAARVFHFSHYADGSPFSETRTDISVNWKYAECGILVINADIPWVLLAPTGTVPAPQSFGFDMCYHDVSLFGGERKRHDCAAGWGTVKV